MVGDDETRVETDTKLTDDLTCGVVRGTHVLINDVFEFFRARFGDGTEVFGDCFPAHTNTGIEEGKGIFFFVCSELDIEVGSTGRLALELSISLFLKCIRAIGEKFSDENFFISIYTLSYDLQ